jgi:hypothetical protein
MNSLHYASSPFLHESSLMSTQPEDPPSSFTAKQFIQKSSPARGQPVGVASLVRVQPASLSSLARDRPVSPASPATGQPTSLASPARGQQVNLSSQARSQRVSLASPARGRPHDLEPSPQNLNLTVKQTATSSRLGGQHCLSSTGVLGRPSISQSTPFNPHLPHVSTPMYERPPASKSTAAFVQYQLSSPMTLPLPSSSSTTMSRPRSTSYLNLGK